MEHDVLLEMKNISKEFPGVKALDNVSLTVRRGTVHALMGENGAGKSTILKCLNGVYPHGSFEGEILIEGKPAAFRTPLDAMRCGIGFVPQEINVLGDMNVAENIFLFDLKNGKKHAFVDHRALRSRTEKLLQDAGIELDADANVRRLSVGQQQMLMIARALATEPKILILDEPTTSLSGQDVQRLFAVVRRMKERGVAVIFVTHKMAEIMEMTDSLTVMRDGKNVGFYERDQYDQNQIVENMIGRKLTVMYPKRDAKIGEEKIRITGLDVPHPYIANRYLVKDFNLCVRKGEVVGLAGLVGAGRSEAMMAVYGELKKSAGSIWIDGAQVRIRTPGDAIRSGIGMVTEDRKKYGLLFSWSIRRNISYSDLRGISTGGFIQPKKEYKAVKQYYQSMRIKANSLNDPVESLSGGNQQKVIFGKWLEREPQVFMMDEPTRGIDVGAKYEIYELIINMAKQGKTVIVVSSEMPEILGITNRIGVMSNGHLSGIVNTKETDQEELLRLSAKYL